MSTGDPVGRSWLALNLSARGSWRALVLDLSLLVVAGYQTNGLHFRASGRCRPFLWVFLPGRREIELAPDPLISCSMSANLGKAALSTRSEGPKCPEIMHPAKVASCAVTGICRTYKMASAPQSEGRLWRPSASRRVTERFATGRQQKHDEGVVARQSGHLSDSPHSEAGRNSRTSEVCSGCMLTGRNSVKSNERERWQRERLESVEEMLHCWMIACGLEKRSTLHSNWHSRHRSCRC